MIRPRSCSGIWQPCQPARSLNVPQTRGKYQVSSSGLEALGQVLGAEDEVRRAGLAGDHPRVVGQAALGVRPAVGIDQLPRRRHADRPSALNVNACGSLTM